MPHDLGEGRVENLVRVLEDLLPVPLHLPSSLQDLGLVALLVLGQASPHPARERRGRGLS